MGDDEQDARSMLIRELCRMTREARDLDLGRSVARKHIDSIRRDLAAFAREHVGGSKPALIDGAVERWPAAAAWTPASLLAREGDTLVTVTATPDGRADAVQPVRVETTDEYGRKKEEGTEEEHFLLPHEERVPLRDFLRPDGTLKHQLAVRYLSSQNGCLEAELPRLLPDLLDPDEEQEEEEEERDKEEEQGDDDDGERRRQRRAAAGPLWARRSMAREGAAAEAVNIWIGDARSETSVHRDPYENVFAVLRGAKTFTLLPPHEAFRLGLEPFPLARWEVVRANDDDDDDDGAPSSANAVFAARPDRPRREVMWTALDPSLERKVFREGRADLAPALERQRARYPLFHGGDQGPSRPRLPPPLEVTVRAGQALYLPAFWWHHVRQSGGEGAAGGGGGCCISVNWWFDASHTSRYALAAMAERLAARAGVLRPLKPGAGRGGGSDEDDEDEG